MMSHQTDEELLLSAYSKVANALGLTQAEQATLLGAPDDDRLDLGPDAFDHLVETIRQIRLSQRSFTQRLTDIYATAFDYDAQDPLTRAFYARVAAFHDDGLGGRSKESLDQDLSFFLDHAERQARDKQPVTMEIWAALLRQGLTFGPSIDPATDCPPRSDV